jgi:hypothetical protein
MLITFNNKVAKQYFCVLSAKASIRGGVVMSTVSHYYMGKVYKPNYPHDLRTTLVNNILHPRADIDKENKS